MSFDTLLINGISLGSVYALIAFGFVLVYRTNRILNFAHAGIGALGALMLSSLLSDGAFGIGLLSGKNPLSGNDGALAWLLSLMIALVFAAILGAVVERVAVRPMRGRPAFAVTIATIGVAIVLQRFADQAPITRNLAMPWGEAAASVGPFSITVSSLIVCLLAPTALGVLALFSRTRFGIAIRAVANDEEAALAQGIDRDRVMAVSWAIAAVLATLAAITFTVPPRGYGTFSTGSMPDLFFRAIPVLALGGWDSFGGVYLAGLGIGLLQVMSGGLFSNYTGLLGPGYSTILPYLVMLAVLLVRPSGLFGQSAIRRV